jgi:hypothetical protein
MTIVRIDRRFCGPPDSGNGGYFAGLLARELGGSGVVVTLKRPAPLGVELRAESEDGKATLRSSEDVLALAELGEVAIDVPSPPGLNEARRAEAGFDQAGHIYPGCFVCGPAREPGDGWRIFPGRFADGRVAAAWKADGEFADAAGHVQPQFVWAALDCPGYFAVQEAAGLALLGRMAVVIHAPVPAEEPLIVQAWAMGSDGRKHRAGTAVHAADGRLLAAADQTWITLR